MGPEWSKWFPIVGAMFFFILIANLLGLIPGIGSVTGDVNTAAAWAIISYVLFNYVGIREHGLENYLIKYMGPTFYIWHVGGKHIHIRPLFWLFFPLEIVLDAARMVTLTIRLIANMFADHTVVAVFLSMVPIGVPAIFIGLGVIVGRAAGLRLRAAHDDLHQPRAPGGPLRWATGRRIPQGENRS